MHNIKIEVVIKLFTNKKGGQAYGRNNVSKYAS